MAEPALPAPPELPLDVIGAVIDFCPSKLVAKISFLSHALAPSFVWSCIKVLNIDEMPTNARISAAVRSALRPSTVSWIVAKRTFDNYEDIFLAATFSFKWAKSIRIARGVLRPSDVQLPPGACEITQEIIEEIELPDFFIKEVTDVIARPCHKLRVLRTDVPTPAHCHIIMNSLLKNTENMESFGLQIDQGTMEDYFQADVELLRAFTKRNAQTLKEVEIRSSNSMTATELPFLTSLFPNLAGNPLIIAPVKQFSLDRFGIVPGIFHLHGLPIWYIWLSCSGNFPPFSIASAMWSEWLADTPVRTRTSALFAYATKMAREFMHSLTYTPTMDEEVQWFLNTAQKILLEELLPKRQDMSPKVWEQACGSLDQPMQMLISLGLGHLAPVEIAPRLIQFLSLYESSLQELIACALEMTIVSRCEWRAMKYIFLHFPDHPVTRPKVISPWLPQHIVELVKEKSQKILVQEKRAYFVDVILLALRDFPVQANEAIRAVYGLIESAKKGPSGDEYPVPLPRSGEAVQILFSLEDSTLNAMMGALASWTDLAPPDGSLMAVCIKESLVKRLLDVVDAFYAQKDDEKTRKWAAKGLRQDAWKLLRRLVEKGKIAGNQLISALEHLITCCDGIPAETRDLYVNEVLHPALMDALRPHM